MTQVRDKDYLMTEHGLIFNVLGYDHQIDKISAGLKYIDGKKWLGNYQESILWLLENHPEYVDQWIQVPTGLITHQLEPADRVRQLLNKETVFEDPLGLLKKSIDLTHQLSSLLNIPVDHFGITDSLLWGSGNENSDIDLVVYGQFNARLILESMQQVYKQASFEIIDPKHIQRPPYLTDGEFLRLAKRKQNQGFYQGTRFSLRSVYHLDEVPQANSYSPVESVEKNFVVSGNQDSLFYPAIYQTKEGIDLVSFHIGYECTLKPGDVVQVNGLLEQSGCNKRVLVGSATGNNEAIRLIS